jgi:hypothetical protein
LLSLDLLSLSLFGVLKVSVVDADTVRIALQRLGLEHTVSLGGFPLSRGARRLAGALSPSPRGL